MTLVNLAAVVFLAIVALHVLWFGLLALSALLDNR